MKVNMSNEEFVSSKYLELEKNYHPSDHHYRRDKKKESDDDSESEFTQLIDDMNIKLKSQENLPVVDVDNLYRYRNINQSIFLKSISKEEAYYPKRSNG